MDLLEAGQLSKEEEMKHWWIRTRFFYLEKSFEYLHPSGDSLKILEIGCGTAQNLRYLREESKWSFFIQQLVGVEPALKEIVPSEPWMRTADILKNSLTAPPASSRFDLIIAMDVLEHIKDDEGALREWAHYLKPGGMIFITVPAFQSLWSRHDELLGHKRRYRRSLLKELAERAGLQEIKSSYAFGYLFPAAFFLRRLLRRNADATTTDLKKNHPLLNSALIQLGRVEARFGGNPLLGTSVVGYFMTPCDDRGSPS